MENSTFYFSTSKENERIYETFKLLKIEKKTREELRKIAASFCILVVDDTMINRWAARESLKIIGYQVKEAKSAREAIQELYKSEQKIDLILMDVGMPKTSGLTLTRYLKGRKKFKDIPIIGLTAFGQHIEEECYRAGMDGLMSKPFDYKLLENFLACFLFFGYYKK